MKKQYYSKRGQAHHAPLRAALSEALASHYERSGLHPGSIRAEHKIWVLLVPLRPVGGNSLQA